MSREYNVDIPVAGIINVAVEADNEEEAIEKAMSVPYTVDFSSDEWDIELLEMDSYKYICQGNTFYAPLNEPESYES